MNEYDMVDYVGRIRRQLSCLIVKNRVIPSQLRTRPNTVTMHHDKVIDQDEFLIKIRLLLVAYFTTRAIHYNNEVTNSYTDLSFTNSQDDNQKDTVMQICKKKIKNTLISTIEVIINEITKDYKAYILSFQDILEQNPDLFSVVVYDDMEDEQHQTSE